MLIGEALHDGITQEGLVHVVFIVKRIKTNLIVHCWNGPAIVDYTVKCLQIIVVQSTELLVIAKKVSGILKAVHIAILDRVIEIKVTSGTHFGSGNWVVAFKQVLFVVTGPKRKNGQNKERDFL